MGTPPRRIGVTKGRLRSPILTRYDALLLDLDGTVYRGTKPIAGASEATGVARASGLTVHFLTNNASRSPATVHTLLEGLQIRAEEGEIYTSAQAGARMAADLVPADSPVLVIGSQALVNEVRNAGLQPVFRADDEPDAVIQGFCPDTSWHELAEASLAVHGDARWIACNGDVTIPTERGLLPGNGSLLAVVREVTGRSPVIAGKPQRRMFDHVVAHAQALRPLVVGDRIDTDIAGATAAGLDSLLVLSGVTSPARLLAAETLRRPRYVSADISALQIPAEDLEISPKPRWRVYVTGDVVRLCSRPGFSEHPDPQGALRSLCAAWWGKGIGLPKVEAADDYAQLTLQELNLLS